LLEIFPHEPKKHTNCNNRREERVRVREQMKLRI
jgi:hypothetical protein